MSSEEPKDGPNKHLERAQQELKSAQNILNFANGSIVFTSDGQGNYTVTNMKQPPLLSTGVTGNITVTANGEGSMSMHQPCANSMAHAVSENREQIYKAFANHINETLRDENRDLKTALDTSYALRRDLEQQNCNLQNRGKALERDARAIACIAEANAMKAAELERKLNNASASLQTMWENHSELLEAHEALRAVVRGLEESDDFNDTVADYEKQVDELTTELDRCEADKHQLMAVCDSQLAKAKEDTLYVKSCLEAEESRRASDWTYCQKRIAELEATQIPEWDRLSLAEKVDRMNSGMTVWQISTGEGPFRTVMEETVKGKGGSTFGMRCRSERGKDKAIEITDLTPHAPVKPVVKKPGVLLCVASLAASFLAALSVSLAASPVTVMVMAVIAFVLTSTLVHKARKAC